MDINLEKNDLDRAGAVRLGHVAPFFVWIGAMGALSLTERFVSLPPLAGLWVYAGKAVSCAALFLWWRPWQVYAPLQRRNVGVALLCGLAVAALWILPESVWLSAYFPGAQAFYHRWLILMPGAYPAYYDPDIFPRLPAGIAATVYDPTICGWWLALLRAAGSALVIAVVEEFFFRGFLYRWLRRKDFWQLPLATYDGGAFWLVVLLFGFEHDRWLVGLMAGALYGLLVLRTSDIWAAALAHGVTNATIAVYVLLCGRYGFW